jgi:hypothetical protein
VDQSGACAAIAAWQPVVKVAESIADGQLDKT